MTIQPFRSIVKNYRVVFLDSYGVLKTYKGLIPGAIETIQYIIESGREFYVLTNDASRSPKQLADKFHAIGLESIKTEHIISSGMMAKEYLVNKIRSGRVAYLGTEDAAHYIDDAGLAMVSISDLDIDDIDDISALVFLDDEGFDWNSDISKAVNLLRRKNIPSIVANSDLTYPASKNVVSIATGGVADIVERIVKKTFIHFGKPDGSMFMYALEQLMEKGEFNKREILMVGDTLYTDILGGNKFGVDTALVLTGNTRRQRAEVLIRSYGIIPDYICESVGT
ncbi:MAG: TIGR01459 family HAD-type hydrolase [Bacteroidota bacterium]